MDLNEFPLLGSVPNKNKRKGYASTLQSTHKNTHDFPALKTNNNNTEVSFGYTNEPSRILIKNNSSQWEQGRKNMFKLLPNQKTEPSQSEDDKYGLLGLVGLIQGIDHDQKMLSIGSDFENLGLGLNRTYSIFSTFLSPWTDNDTPPPFPVELGYNVPEIYQNITTNPPAYDRINTFTDEILFYGFYSMSRDIVQEVSANELYKRNWRYHKPMGIWITKEIKEDGKSNEPIAFNNSSKTNAFEHGTFIIFDPSIWKRVTRELTIFWDAIEIKI